MLTTETLPSPLLPLHSQGAGSWIILSRMATKVSSVSRESEQPKIRDLELLTPRVSQGNAQAGNSWTSPPMDVEPPTSAPLTL